MKREKLWQAWDEPHASADLDPLVLHPARLRDPRTIPPRQWLYGTQLLRGFVTVLVAPGGTGKTAYAMVVAASCAAGVSLLGEHVFERINVAVLNLEDPMEELERRLASIRLHYRLRDGQLANRYFLHSGEDRAVTIAAPADEGFDVIYPDEEALTREIQTHDIGLIVVDPFAESHSLEENSNPQMVKASAAWRRVARATSCGILLVHHVRKGVVTDIDSARGAKSLTDSARVGLLMSPMSAEDGERLGVKEPDRGRYIRLDDAKANMAPKAAKARWFKLEREELRNGGGNYPNGDGVAVIAAWQPPSAMENLTGQDCNDALDVIARGPEPGVLFTASKKGGSQRWAGKVLVDRFDRTEGQAAQIIDTWLKSGLLYESEYTHPTYRRPATGVRVNPINRPS